MHLHECKEKIPYTSIKIEITDDKDIDLYDLSKAVLVMSDKQSDGPISFFINQCPWCNEDFTISNLPKPNFFMTKEKAERFLDWLSVYKDEGFPDIGENYKLIDEQLEKELEKYLEE
jgi:hypothetical protein